MFVFTYGSLQVEAVWTRVAGVRCETAPGVAHGYSAYRVSGQDYPGMVADAAGSTAGLVYFDVPDHAVARLDRFEGSEYSRRPIDVKLENGERLSCQAYVFLSLDGLTTESWRLNEFLTTGAVERFTARYVGFTEIEGPPHDA
ncbi:MAG: gamma-glutamylcyclotransferase [Planctomycetales bacterium]|nr:gamma-glutamylcyclotransferase [Planctomycetales bacterium]